MYFIHQLTAKKLHLFHSASVKETLTIDLKMDNDSPKRKMKGFQKTNKQKSNPAYMQIENTFTFSA